MMDDIPFIDYLVYKILSLVANPTNVVSQSIEVLLNEKSEVLLCVRE